MKPSLILKSMINASSEPITLASTYTLHRWNKMYRIANRYYLGNAAGEEVCFAKVQDLLPTIADDFKKAKDAADAAKKEADSKAFELKKLMEQIAEKGDITNVEDLLNRVGCDNLLGIVSFTSENGIVMKDRSLDDLNSHDIQVARSLYHTATKVAYARSIEVRYFNGESLADFTNEERISFLGLMECEENSPYNTPFFGEIYTNSSRAKNNGMGDSTDYVINEFRMWDKYDVEDYKKYIKALKAAGFTRVIWSESSTCAVRCIALMTKAGATIGEGIVKTYKNSFGWEETFYGIVINL